VSDFTQPWETGRSRTRQAPLGVWRAAVFIAVTAILLSVPYFIFVRTPFSITSDQKFFGAQLQSLEEQSSKVAMWKHKPLKILFVGTSRTKNVALDPEAARVSAMEAGVQRPVASAYWSINWGGFERLAPAMEQLLEAKPDYIVFQPELLIEDLNWKGRLKFALRYLNSVISNTEYRVFDPDNEFSEPICVSESIANRQTRHSSWIGQDIYGKGPVLAAQWIRRFSDNRIQVLIAPIPVHSKLSGVRSEAPKISTILAHHGLAGLQRVTAIPTGKPLPNDLFCDFAHIAPSNASAWLDRVFSTVVRIESGLQK
jgi:hypothetical protein